MKKKNKGFTLVELVIVIAVIAILAAVLIPTFSAVIKNANNSADLQLVNNLNIVAATHQATGNSNEFDSADNIRKMLKEEGINPDSIATKNKDVIIVYNTETQKFERCTLNKESNGLAAFADTADFNVGYYLEEIFENKLIVSTGGNDLAEAIHNLHNLPSDVNKDYISRQLKKIPSALQEKVMFILESSVFINAEGKVVTFNGSTEPTISNEITEDKTRIIFYEQEQEFDFVTLSYEKTSLVSIIPNYVTLVGDDFGEIYVAGNTGTLEDGVAKVETVADTRERVKKADKKRSTILSIAGDLELTLYDFYGNSTLEDLGWENFKARFEQKFSDAIDEKGENVESITLNSMTDNTNNYPSDAATSVYGGTYRFNATVDGIALNKLIKFKTVQIGNSVSYNKTDDWYTVEDALATAKSGNIVIVAGSTSKNYTSCDAIVTSFTALGDAETGYGDAGRTIKPGVTLVLPYDGANASAVNTEWGNDGNSAKYRSGQSLGNTNYKKIDLLVPAGISITNKGILNIGGVTDGGTPSSDVKGSGKTSGRYAQITLGEGASIYSDGNINAYGFIVEETQNNGSEVIMNSGTLLMPLVITEHRGGNRIASIVKGGFTESELLGILISSFMGGSIDSDKMQVMPFNRYYMQNVTSALKVNSGANVNGLVNLYIEGYQKAEVKFIGNTDACFFRLKDNSYVEWKYDIGIQVINIDTYGNIDLNPLTIDLKLNIGVAVDCHISTNNVFLPIPWHYNVTLNTLNEDETATVNSNQDIKLLPGANLKIADGVTANFKKFVVYGDDWNDIGTSGLNKDLLYPTADKGSANLTVNGIMNVTDFGEYGTTETAPTGELNVTGIRGIASLELAGTDTEVLAKGSTPVVGSKVKGKVLSVGTVSYPN